MMPQGHALARIPAESGVRKAVSAPHGYTYRHYGDSNELLRTLLQMEQDL